MPGFSYDLHGPFEEDTMQTLVTPQGSYLCSPIHPRVVGAGNIIVHRETAYHVHDAMPVVGMHDVYEVGVVVSLVGDETFTRQVLLFKIRDFVQRFTGK